MKLIKISIVAVTVFFTGIWMILMAVATPFMWLLQFVCPPLRRWIHSLPNPMSTPEPGYIIEVQIQVTPLFTNEVTDESEPQYNWFPVGTPRKTLANARAGLEAVRRIKKYGLCNMRIRKDEYPLIEVKPEDPPLVELR